MNRKKRKRSSKRTSPPPQTAESQTAEAATVAWMLALFSTFSAECVGVMVRLMMLSQGESDRLRVLSVTLLLVALLSGVLTLILTPVVLRLRTVAPPRGIVLAAYLMGVVPIATLILIGLVDPA